MPGYNGPTPNQMFATHTFAQEVIERNHDEEQAIFDEHNLALLNEFVSDPAAHKELLTEWGMDDKAGEKVGTGAQKYGSLVGYIVAKHAVGEPVLLDNEIERLKDWFDGGKK